MRKSLILLMLTMTISFLSSAAIFADETESTSAIQEIVPNIAISSDIISPDYMFDTVIDRIVTKYKVWKISGERDIISSKTYYKELRFQNNYELDYIETYAMDEAETEFYRIENWYEVYHYITW
ncbi:hypothetical protein [Lutispora thermophila]|uniref:Uncharacterized protein n=1 Tax=Lutispora thermophila DSM 19022 TaxID=1122184 RepID=A0A1M6B274_9FIRM|nr:hypothetical protein [Lutispora thermophila]SHI42573.1 hypothetical protein SAMN02745176_00223 [Lutispora thermophila DSM 19022]